MALKEQSTSPLRVLVTGGCGFIGSNLVRWALQREDIELVVNLDALTYAGNQENLAGVDQDGKYRFVHGNILDSALVTRLLGEYSINTVFHLAAESHVDRSIEDPGGFVETNVEGTYRLLQAALDHQKALPLSEAEAFRFVHVSTDEVYGSLRAKDPAFTEETPYQPNSPYAASKAAADHFARAYFETYGLPVVITNCSNNYGPYQFPEKLIPLMILNAVEGKPLPVYGDGSNVRDWLYVADHCRGLFQAAIHGRPGEKYNFGGNCERTNLQVVQTICSVLEDIRPGKSAPYQKQITFVQDRPGHDWRYAIDARKVERELGWKPEEDFESGLRRTVAWYMENEAWWQAISQKNYDRQRLGLQVGSSTS